VLTLGSAARAQAPVAPPPTTKAVHDSSRAEAGGRGHQWVEMRNVDLHLTDKVVIRVRRLHGEVLRTAPDQPAALDDVRSFRIKVTGATVALTGNDLGAILNSVVFAYPNAPLRDIQIRTEGNEIVQTGVMHKGVDLRFRLRGTLDLTADGQVRIHPSSVRVVGLNGEKVLHFLGLRLQNMLDLKGAHGASVKGDDFFLDPLAILPPPAIDGRLAGIGIEGDKVVLEFAQLPADSVFGGYVRADSADPNFIYFRGGQLRFGKLLMTDTDLRIVDADPRTPFDMDLPHYTRQLVAGHSRTLPNLGLVVYMPDFASLGHADSTSRSSASRTR
jgi:hypothetical protein